MWLASQEQRHREQDISDSPFQEHMVGMGRLREEATRGSLQSLAPCPEPLDMRLQLWSGVSTSLRTLWSLWTIKWPHQIRGVGCACIPPGIGGCAWHPTCIPLVSPQGGRAEKCEKWQGEASSQVVFPARPGPSGCCQEAGSMRGVRSQSASCRC